MLFSRNKWFSYLLAELTITNIALFSGFSVIAVHLVVNLGFSAAQASLAMACSTFGLRFARIPLAPLLDKINPRRAIPVAILISMTGYLGLAFSSGVISVSLFLMLVGIGYGTNGLLVTTLASKVSTEKAAMMSRYVLMNTMTNVAASVGPLMAAHLAYSYGQSAPFLLSALVLCGSFVVSLMIPDTLPQISSDSGWLKSVKELAADPIYLLALLVIASGWLVYTQKFASIPLFISEVLHEKKLIGWLLTIYAVVIISSAGFMNRLIKARNLNPMLIIITAFVVYTIGYLLIWNYATKGTMYLAVVIFALAEGAMMPSLNALVGQVTSESNRLTAFSLTAAAIGTGEALGNVMGISLFKYFEKAGNPADVFLTFAILSTTFALTAMAVHKKGASPRNASV